MPNERRQRSDTPQRPIIAEDRAHLLVAITDDAIRARAYQLYEARGGQPGAELHDWLRAEQELREPTDGIHDDAA
jgi:hypothetical protein